MRVLYHHRILARDGMQVHVGEIVDALRRRGHTVALVGPTPGDGATPALPSLSIVEWLGGLRHRLPAWASELLELAYNVVAWRRLKAEARAFAPDVIYERYNLFLLVGVWLKRALDVPLIVEVNAPLVHERATYAKLTLTPLARWAERYVWCRADAVLPVSQALAAFVREAGVAAERVVVIPNGVRPEAYQEDGTGPELRRRLGLEGRVVFGFVGFARPWHGLERVLDAFVQWPGEGPHLLVVGDGPARAGLEARAAALGLSDRLTITGAVPHAAIPGYLRAFDVALQPDVTPYASPLKLFEYMAAGRAIIAPDRPNIREIVVDGETAVLFDPEQPGRLESAIARLAGDAALRDRLGAAAAREIVRRGRTWDANAARIEAVAEELLGRASEVRSSPAPKASNA